MNLLIILSAVLLLLVSILIGKPWKRGINIATPFIYILVAILLFFIPLLIPLGSRDAHSNFPGIHRAVYGLPAFMLFSFFALIMTAQDIKLSWKNAQPSVGIKNLCGVIYIFTLIIFLWGLNMALSSK